MARKKPEPERIVMPSNLTDKPRKKSPLIQQWEETKKRHPGMLIMFKVGDFYELFGEDAEKAAKALDLTVTRRDDFPMAGFPARYLEVNLRKMLRSGLRVAIAEPVQETKPSTDTEGMLSMGQAARYLHVAPRTVMKWVDSNRLPATRNEKGDRFVRRDDLVRFMQAYDLQVPPELLS